MAVDIGPKIGIDGEAEFRKQLNNVNQSLKTLGSEMKIVTAEFGANAKSEEALTKQNDILQRSVSTLKDKLDMQQKALEESARAYGEADTRTMKWQQAVNETQAALADAERQTKENEKALENLGKEEDNAGKKGEKLGEALKKGAEAAAAALAALGAAVIAAGKGIVDMATQTAEAGDAIDKSSQKVGMSAEAYQKWDYVLQRSGTSMDAAATGINKLTNTFDDAKNGSAKAVSAFESIGLSMEEIQNMSREDLFGAVINGLQGVADDAEKAALANDLFGKSGQDLLPVLNSSNEEIQGLMNKAEEYGMIMSNETVSASAAFNDSLTDLKNTFAGVKNSIAGDLLPGFTMITDGLAGLVAGQEGAGAQITEGVTELVGQITDKIPEITNIIVELAQIILEQAPTIIDSLASGIMNALPTLTPVVTDIILKIVEVLTNNLPQIINMAIEIIVTLAGGLIKAIPQLVKAVPQLLTALINGFLALSAEIAQIGIDIVKGIWSGIQSAWEWLKEKFNKLLNGLLGGVKKLLGISSPSRVFAEIGGYMAEGLGEGWEKEFGAVQRDINGSMESLLPTSSANIGVVSDMRGTGVLDGVRGAMADAVNAMGTLAYAGAGASGNLTIIAQVNGREFYRGSLADFRLVQRENPIILNDF